MHVNLQKRRHVKNEVAFSHVKSNAAECSIVAREDLHQSKVVSIVTDNARVHTSSKTPTKRLPTTLEFAIHRMAAAKTSQSMEWWQPQSIAPSLQEQSSTCPTPAKRHLVVRLFCGTGDFSFDNDFIERCRIRA